MKIGVIVSTTRPNRVGRTIAEWFMEQVKDVKEAKFELIDLQEENLPFLDEPMSPSMGNYQNEHTKNWGKKIAGYDGYVWVTAEYNHGYPAPLKNAIDTVYAEWAKKPVAFVGYGGLGGVRSIEQLAQVAVQLNMVPLASTGDVVTIVEVWSSIDEVGALKPEYIKGSPEKLTQSLLWWAKVLKPAREQQ